MLTEIKLKLYQSELLHINTTALDTSYLSFATEMSFDKEASSKPS